MMIKFAVVFALFVQGMRQEGCNIPYTNAFDSVVLSSEDLEFVYPPVENSPDNRNITLPVGATIIISCNGGHFSNSSITTKTIAATCNQDFQLEAQDTIIDYSKIECVNFNPQRAKITNIECGPNAVLIEVGFQIGINIKFLPQVKICFDTKTLIPLYANYNLTKSIKFIKSYLTRSYVIDSVYNINVDFETLYNNVSFQEEQINKLLGLPLNSTEYVNPRSCDPDSRILTTPGFCFTKRHLAYRGAFVYISQQNAAFRYINVAPQWSFLDYNLDKLENNVIDYVKNNKLDLEVYTGTWGVATLPHSTTDERIELFLYVDGDNKSIPVPLIFWKLIYDRITARATVFLTINDPYQADVSQNVVCNDISDEITWLTWEKHNVTKGYSYACSYDEVKAVITYLPELIVNDILI